MSMFNLMKYKCEIDGLIITPLKQFKSQNGKVMHMLKENDKVYKRFGEIYFSLTNPGIIKGWYQHKKNTSNFAVIKGILKLVIFDDRSFSNSSKRIKEIILSEDNYSLITIPPLIWYGFKSIGNDVAILANCTDFPHDQSESNRIDVDDSSIPYDW